MAAILVKQAIFEQLKQAYSEKFGSSPTDLINRLNYAYQHELLDNSSGDLISARTLRNFFNAAKPPKMQEKNLNYLCSVLLERKSYRDALKQVEHLMPDAKGAWFKGYQKNLDAQMNSVRTPNMTEPRPLTAVYIETHFQEDIRRRRRKSIAELMDDLEGENDNSFFQKAVHAANDLKVVALEVVEKHQNLMIWGKPGSGKTTFLKYLALHFAAADSDDTPIPVFVSLRELSEKQDAPGLVGTLIQQIAAFMPETAGIEQWLAQGKFLILLDGLDEVLEANSRRIYNEIERLSQQYAANRVVMTCRFGGSDYIPANFKEVEIAGFETEQIDKFVRNWFKESGEDGVEEKFLTRLQENAAIWEFAGNPLLLTMLCSIYENGYEFPRDRHSLYDDAVDLFLKRWDSFRRIDRDPIYKGKLTRPRRQSLFAKIAYDGLSRMPRKYFWKQRELEDQIREFLHNIPSVEDDTLDVDTKETIKAMEKSHGLVVEQARNVFSFSHLTFQEYFAAEYLLERPGSGILSRTIEEHLTDRQWKEVFLMVLERLANADELVELIFSHANDLMGRTELQDWLVWVDRVTQVADISSSSWRACYLSFDLETDLYISHTLKHIDRALAQTLADKLRQSNKARNKILPRTPRSQLELDLAVLHTLIVDRSVEKPSNVNRVGIYDDTYRSASLRDFDIASRLKLDIEIAQQIGETKLASELALLQERLPANDALAEELAIWASQLQSVMKQHLDVGYGVTLSKEDSRALEDYLYVVNLLVESFQGDIYCSKELREQVLGSILLPRDRIPARFLPASLQSVA